MDSIYDLLFASVVSICLTMGIVQLIDYERQRKFRYELYRKQLRMWFHRKMYNYHTYGNINGDPRYNRSASFYEDHPEYDLDKIFEEQTDPDNVYKNKNGRDMF